MYFMFGSGNIKYRHGVAVEKTKAFYLFHNILEVIGLSGSIANRSTTDG